MSQINSPGRILGLLLGQFNRGFVFGLGLGLALRLAGVHV
jgi:hypothetical protein